MRGGELNTEKRKKGQTGNQPGMAEREYFLNLFTLSLSPFLRVLRHAGAEDSRG